MKKHLSLGVVVLFSVLMSSLAWSAEEQRPTEQAVVLPSPSPVSEAPAAEPFAFADFTWLNGNSRQKTFPLDTKMFTGEFTLDTNYIVDFNHPADHTLIGSTNAGRTSEFQVEQLGIGGDFHYENIRGRLMTQFGMYSTMTPRNDASPSRGQWDLSDAYRYVSEAYGGYHLDVWNGINIDVGIFMSYIGLCSYYNFDNWVYQMSYVSSNTPWFFNGVRIQTFPTDRLKIEYWIINGWQSYGMFNEMPGLGFEILWRPSENFSFVSNNYYGKDTYSNVDRLRFHTDNSAQYKYLDHPSSNFLSKGAFSLTVDAGCESGGGVSCASSGSGGPEQNFLGFMLYNRFWFKQDHFGLTIGGGAITNPGRYLVLLPPINGATASSSSYYFPESPGTEFRAWDGTVTFDYMPSQFITWRVEFNHRQSNVPYFAGPGGITPNGGNQGLAGSQVTNEPFNPDLQESENRINLSMMIRL